LASGEYVHLMLPSAFKAYISMLAPPM